MRWIGYVVIGLSLLACSPLWDWREINQQERGYVALFPAKPAQAERMITLAGEAHRFYLQTVQVGEVQFALGVLTPTMPPDVTSVTNRDQLLSTYQQALQQAMLKNFQAKVIRTEQLGRVNETVSSQTPVIWTHYWADGKLPDGKSPGKPIRVQARWAVYRHHVWQMLMVAPQEMSDEAVAELADMWFPGLRWTR